MPLKILSSVQTSGILIAPESTTNNASIRVPHGVAPTSPTNGDIWTTSAGLHVRISGATINLGNGTVTSVGLALPAIFSVSNSPVTTSGTLTATLASQTANTFLAAPSGSNGVPSFRAIVDADIPITYTASLRANVNISGGGTITVNATGSVLWSQRFIIISNGRGSNFSTNGYFDITCPTSGTITGVGGASNKTATAAGIPLSEWEAIYYILPIGSGSASVAANFRVVNYTSNLDIPDEWVLVCLRNGENSQFYFTAGYTLPLSGSIITGTYNARRANFADQLTTARTIGGVSFDGSANINLPGVNTAGNQNTTGSAATLTTARTLTIGSTGKTFNGSANVAWTLAEIGATPITGGTGYIQNQSASAQSASFWINGSSIMNNLITERANDANIGQGQIYLNGATGNRIDFNTNGVAAPTLNTTSVGSKIVLFPQVSASSVDYALGIESNHMWFSVPTSNSRFKFYAGTTNVTSIYGNGNIVTTGEISTTGNVTGHTFGGDIGSFNELIADTTLIVGDGSNTTTAYAIIKNLYLSKDDVAGGKNLLFESDTTTIDNKKLSFKIVDSSTGSKTSVMTMTTTERVGVGTDSPNAKFQVSGAGSGAEVFLVSPSGAPTVGIKADSTITDYSGLYIGNKHIIRSKDSATVFFNIQDGLTYLNNNTARTTMNSDGSLGLGIISSANINSRLHVRGTGATSSTTALRVENSNASASLVVRDDGNVGIGTTNPGAKLEIDLDGTGKYLRFNDWSGNYATYGWGITSNIDKFRLPSIVYFGDSSFYFQKSGLNGFLVSFNDLQLGSSNTANGGSKVYLYGQQSTGNVGIGTASPAAKLHVHGGDIYINYNQYLGGGTAYNSVWNRILMYNGGSGDMEITMHNVNWYLRHNANATFAGNVGIGITSPGARLQVRGSGATSATTALRVENSNASASLVVRDDGAILIGTANTQAPFIAGSTGTSIFGSSQRALGFVWNGGAGNRPNPSFYFTSLTDINWTTSTGEILTIGVNFNPTSGTGVLNTSVITPTINQTGGANGITRGLYVNPILTAASDWRSIEWSNNTGFGLYGAGTANNYLAGNLGIGTTNPSSSLHVEGDVQIGTNKLKLGASNADSYIQHNGSNLITHFQSNWGGDFKFRAADLTGTQYDILFIEGSNQRVGIGTTIPYASLHTVGAGIVNIVQSSDTVSYTQYYNSSTGTNTTNDGLTVGINGLSAYVFNREAGNLIFGTSGTERMSISSAGNVGIGTSSPTYTLDISTTNATSPFRLLDTTASGYKSFNVTYTSSFTTQLNFGSLGRVEYDGNGGVLTVANTSTQAGTSRIRFVMGSTEAMRIADTRNIAIGTTTTTGGRLTIQGSGATSATTALRVENSAGTPGLIVRDDGRTFVGEDYTFTSSQRYYLLEASADGLVIFTNNTTNVAQTTGFFSGELYLDGSQPYTNHRAVNAITTCRNTSTSNVIRALYVSGRTNNSGAASTVTGLTGDLNIEGSGSVTNAIAVEVGMYSLTNTKTITNMYGLRVNDIINTVGTITNTYGIHVGDVTSGTQTNTAYSLYVSDANARSYFAGKVGIGQTNPTNLFEVYSSTTPKLVVGSANVGLQIAPNEFVDIASYPTDNKYIRIRADKVSNNPHYEAGSPQEGMGVLDNNVYLAEPNYWIEIKLGGDGGDNPVLIPCYLPKP